jgi:hypothetical protein
MKQEEQEKENCQIGNQSFIQNRVESLESISPTLFKRNCAIFFAPINSLTFTSSTKKLCTKLSYEKAARKMLVK